MDACQRVRGHPCLRSSKWFAYLAAACVHFLEWLPVAVAAAHPSSVVLAAVRLAGLMRREESGLAGMARFSWSRAPEMKRNCRVGLSDV